MNVFGQAKWIFADVKGEIVDRYFDYIKVFDVCGRKDTKLYISAHSQYAVYVNGQFVDCGQYDDYEDMKFFDVLPITGFLNSGRNEILVQQYVCGKDFATRQRQIPGVIFAASTGDEILLVSDTDCMVRENRSFASNAELLTPQIGFNFEYDATVGLPECVPCIEVKKTKNLFPRPIQKLIIEPVTGGRLVAQGVFLEWKKEAPKARRCQHAYFSACECTELLHQKEQNESMFDWLMPKDHRGDGVYFIFDMGGENAGLLEFEMELPGTCEVLISVGEHLDDLRVRSAVGPRNFTFRYIAEKGQNHFFYPFQRLGLRYIQVMIYSERGHIDYVGIRRVSYPLIYRTIPVKDGLHKMIWETGRKTLELCMHEHYEDCPWREQSLYGMDGRVQILCGYYAFGEYDFPKASMRLMAHSLREDKLLELCPPGKIWVNIPSFTAIFVREVMEYIEYSGDTEFAKEMLPVLTEIVQGFESHINENGLIPQWKGQWNFYEWREGLDGAAPEAEDTCDCLLNAFVSDSFRCFARICEIAGSALSEKYMALHQRINKAAHKAFWREAAGGYATYLTDEIPMHELSQAMMIYAGATPKEKQGTVAELMKSRTLIPCSLSMTIFFYDALLQVTDDNYDYVIGHIEEKWGRMLRSNTDTFWETDKGADDFENAGSLCHGWAAVPIYIWGRYGEL